MDWQAIVVGVVVLGAAGYLARRGYLAYKRPACGDACSSCPSKGKAGQGKDELVQIRIPGKRKGP